MVKATIVGFPRLGPMREAKTAIESYWNGKGIEIVNISL